MPPAAEEKRDIQFLAIHDIRKRPDDLVASFQRPVLAGRAEEHELTSLCVAQPSWQGGRLRPKFGLVHWVGDEFDILESHSPSGQDRVRVRDDDFPSLFVRQRDPPPVSPLFEGKIAHRPMFERHEGTIRRDQQRKLRLVQPVGLDQIVSLQKGSEISDLNTLGGHIIVLQLVMAMVHQSAVGPLPSHELRGRSDRFTAPHPLPFQRELPTKQRLSAIEVVGV